MTWEDGDGEIQSLTTRYHKAAAHLVNAASDFGRRQEPRLLAECARRFIAFDHEDRLAAAGGGSAGASGATRPARLPGRRPTPLPRCCPPTIRRPASCACTATSTTTCSSTTWPARTRS